MRLIDADVALKNLEDLKKSPWYHFDNPFVQQGMRECMEVVEVAVIDVAPTVDAIPIEFIYGLIKSGEEFLDKYGDAPEMEVLIVTTIGSLAGLRGLLGVWNERKRDDARRNKAAAAQADDDCPGKHRN